MSQDESRRTTVLVHYYRAMVGRADVWRMRMDTTTNWAVGATAAVLSFALGSAAVPHYVLHVSAFMTATFLLLEARRLTFYHLWQHRVLELGRHLVRPALDPASSDGSGGWDDAAFQRELAAEVGTTVPSMPLSRAVARRLRRVYVYLFAVQGVAWWVKLASAGSTDGSLAEVVSRAAIGIVPGDVVFVLTGAALGLAIGLAVGKGGSARSKEPAID